MTLKSVTAKILQITGLVTAATGLVKSLIDLIEVGTPHFTMKKMSIPVDRYGPMPPPPPPELFWNEYYFIIGPVIIVAGICILAVAQKMRMNS